MGIFYTLNVFIMQFYLGEACCGLLRLPPPFCAMAACSWLRLQLAACLLFETCLHPASTIRPARLPLSLPPQVPQGISLQQRGIKDSTQTLPTLLLPLHSYSFPSLGGS